MDEAAWSPRCFQARVDQMSSSLTIEAENLPRRAGPYQSGHVVDLVHSTHALPERTRLVHAPLGNRHRRKPRDPAEPSGVPDKTADLVALSAHRLHEVAPDESCPSGHENPHATSSTKAAFHKFCRSLTSARPVFSVRHWLPYCSRVPRTSRPSGSSFFSLRPRTYDSRTRARCLSDGVLAGPPVWACARS